MLGAGEAAVGKIDMVPVPLSYGLSRKLSVHQLIRQKKKSRMQLWFNTGKEKGMQCWEGLVWKFGENKQKFTRPVVSNWGSFAPTPRGHMAMSGDIFGYHDWVVSRG